MSAIRLARLFRIFCLPDTTNNPSELRQFCCRLLRFDERRRAMLHATTEVQIGDDRSGKVMSPDISSSLPGVWTKDVEALWLLLRHVAGPAQYPPMRPGPYTADSFVSAVDRVIAWCDEQMTPSTGVVASGSTCDPNRPGEDRQRDIIAAIISEGTPLTRPELVVAMRMKSEGKLGHQLSWMVKNRKLLNIKNRGYWPCDQAVPE